VLGDAEEFAQGGGLTASRRAETEVVEDLAGREAAVRKATMLIR
jgi:hypothetical protein